MANAAKWGALVAAVLLASAAHAAAEPREEGFRTWVLASAGKTAKVLEWGGALAGLRPDGQELAFVADVCRDGLTTSYFELADGTRWVLGPDEEGLGGPFCEEPEGPVAWSNDRGFELSRTLGGGANQSETRFAFREGVPVVLRYSDFGGRQNTARRSEVDYAACTFEEQWTEGECFEGDPNGCKLEDHRRSGIPAACPQDGDIPLMEHDAKGKRLDPWGEPPVPAKTRVVWGKSPARFTVHAERIGGAYELVASVPKMDEPAPVDADLKTLLAFDHFELWRRDQQLSQFAIVLDRKNEVRCMDFATGGACPFQAALEQGRLRIRALHTELRHSPWNSPRLPLQDAVTLVFSDGDGRKQRGLVATSALEHGKADSLGRIYDRAWRWPVVSGARKAAPAPGTPAARK